MYKRQASGSSGSVAASDEDFVKDALHDFSEEIEDYAPGTTAAFSLDGSSVTLGLLADKSQFTDDEIMGIANEVLEDVYKRQGSTTSPFRAKAGRMLSTRHRHRAMSFFIVFSPYCIFFFF